MTAIIAASTIDNAIGHRGDLLYHIPDDLKRFKSLTMGHPIIMGRKTFESFPKGALPGRRNIVVTRQPHYSAPGIETAQSLSEALDMTSGGPEAYIIGGAEIYTQALAMGIADRLELTLIDAEAPAADTRVHWPVDLRALVGAGNVVLDRRDPRSGVAYAFVTLAL